MNYTLKVTEVRRETEDTVTLCFKQPGLKKIKYLAGQYLTLIFRINGRRYIRPYSFSSCPNVDTLLEVTIKRILNGVVSNHIHDKIQIGDVVEVMSPMGDFTFEDLTVKEVYLWCAGSGITPLFSIAKQILHSSPAILLQLIYGNKNAESTIFLDKLRELEQLYPERFKIRHFHTQFSVDQDNPYVINGRIDHKIALEILQEQGDHNQTLHYICGPVGLKESVKNALSTVGVSSENIFSEDFELVKNPQDFLDVHTQLVNVNFQQKDYMLEVVKGKSVLEAALDTDLELPYSCQTGNCSTCKAKLIHGTARMIGLSKTRDDLEKDEYLLCCTHPLTDNTHFEL